MRFTDTLLRQVRDRVSIADYAGKRLTWDKHKTRPSAGDYWACCPFHQEKSPSFHVLDQKGIFNCFGCGEKGDVFTLAMKLEGLSFPEAVEKFAEYRRRAAAEGRVRGSRRERSPQAPLRCHRRGGDAVRRRAALLRRRRSAPLPARARHSVPMNGSASASAYAPDEWTWAIDKLKAEGFTHRGDRRRRRRARRRRRQARHRHLPWPHHLRDHRHHRQSHRLRRPRAQRRTPRPNTSTRPRPRSIPRAACSIA